MPNVHNADHMQYCVFTDPISLFKNWIERENPAHSSANLKEVIKSCERIQKKLNQEEKRNQLADTLAGFEKLKWNKKATTWVPCFRMLKKLVKSWRDS